MVKEDMRNNNRTEKRKGFERNKGENEVQESEASNEQPGVTFKIENIIIVTYSLKSRNGES
jgi:hypothetical protein